MSLAFVVVIARFSVYLTFCYSFTVGDIYMSFTHSQIPTKTHRTSGFVIQINIYFSFYYLLRERASRYGKSILINQDKLG